MKNNTKSAALKLVTLAAFFAFGLARPQHATAASDTTYGEGISATAQGAGVAGDTGGLIGVDASSGGAAASLPFQLPRARGAVQPALSLAYRAGLDGEAGFGWGLSLPAIERKPLSNLPHYENDPQGAATVSDQTDRMTIAGSTLVPLCKVGVSACPAGEIFPSWANGWHYYREQIDASHSRYYWSPDGVRWRVESQSGEVAEFGVPQGTTDERGVDREVELGIATPVRAASTPGIFRWNLVRRFEAAHPENYVAYVWENGPWQKLKTNLNRGYLTDLYYTAPAGSPAPGDGPLPLPGFAHHVHLVYGDVPYDLPDPGNPWFAPRAERLLRVEVASKDFGATTADPRRQVRRYWLGYDEQGPRRSLLTSVATEGNQDGAGAGNVEDGDFNLPSKQLLMSGVSTTLEYTPGQLAAPAYPVDIGVNFADDIGASGFNFSNYGITFVDLNRDGVPDVTRPSSPLNYVTSSDGTSALYHGFAFSRSWFGTVNGFSHLEGFDPGPQLLHVPSAYMDLNDPAKDTDCPVDAHALLNRESPSLVGDWSGRDQTVVLFDGTLKACAFRFDSQTGFQREKNLPVGAPLQMDAPLVDLDGDGLLDAVRGNTTPTRFSKREHGQVFPFVTLLPLLAVTGGQTYADLDGDGAADAIDLGPTPHWCPGDGRGDFGPCPFNSNFAHPLPVRPDLFHDVNGDGLADAIFVAYEAGFVEATIRLNTGNGTTFGGNGRESMYILPIGQANNSVQHLAFADMNGSGTDDIIAFNGGHLSFVDVLDRPLGSTRPYALKSISNGLGATTSLTYARSVDLDAKARGTADQWTSHSVVPFDVVETIETTAQNDHHVAKYSYANPVFDGWNHRVRGFRKVSIRETTGLEPNTVQHLFRETSFLIGACGAPNKECDLTQDPEKDSMTSLPPLPFVTDVSGIDLRYSTEPVHLSTSWTTYIGSASQLGLDGRYVVSVAPSAADTLIYDTAPFVPSVTPQSVTVLSGSIGYGDREPSSVTVPGTVVTYSAANVHLRQAWEYDGEGHAIRATNYGVVGAHPDQPIETTSDWALTPGSTWTWRDYRDRTKRFPVSASDRATYDRVLLYGHDASGRVTYVGTALEGSGKLQRFHENPVKVTAPDPSNAASDGLVVLSTRSYDAFGNLQEQSTADGGCVRWDYEKAFAGLPVAETVFVNGCGNQGLGRTTFWDAGLQVPIDVNHADGSRSTYSYDAFGRVTEVDAPDPTKVGWTVMAAQITYYDPSYGEYTLPARVRVSGPSGESWSFINGLGRVLGTLRQADQANGDGGDWIASGYSDRPSEVEERFFEPWFYTGSPLLFPLSPPPAQKFTRAEHDVFGRESAGYARDGTLVARAQYHMLSADSYDEGNVRTTVIHNGQGRVTEKQRAVGQDVRVTDYTYQSTGEPTTVTESGGGSSIMRWMAYDSLGRLVENGEPNSTANFGSPQAAGQIPWRYAYDFGGRLVGTSDSRGCGRNLFYDGVGRKIAEDLSPCLDSQDDYTAPNLATGDGTESYLRYDSPEPGQSSLVGNGIYRGRLASSSDRGAHDLLEYDGRGRPVSAKRQLARPGSPAASLATRYAPHVFEKDRGYDLADRTWRETTGADVAELLGSNTQSEIDYLYTARGMLGGITSSYEVLASAMHYDVNGASTDVTYGDALHTKATATYADPRGRASELKISRATGAIQTLADDVLTYTQGDLRSVLDQRNPAEWEAGAKPVSRTYQHDTDHRVRQVDYTFPTPQGDTQVSPFVAGDSSPVPRQLLSSRAKSQTFEFDIHGRLTSSDDDQHAIWDRSLGAVGPYAAQKHQMTSSANGAIHASYDAAGNIVRVDVNRQVSSCSSSTGMCAQVFAYDWDEVGQLARARRWDEVTIPATLPAEPPAADLHYTYSGGNRVLRSSGGGSAGAAQYTADVFATLRLVGATWNGTDYERTSATEAVYLGGLARVVYSPTLPPQGSAAPLHVFYTLGDELGSTSTVIDDQTGDVVERVTYGAYGTTDSDYRPAAWGAFREAFRFTGKEDDIEVGLTYFGARYYAPNLQRWLSPDPLTVHGPGPAVDPYAYVDGSVATATDPDGLCSYDNLNSNPCQAFDGGFPGMVGYLINFINKGFGGGGGGTPSTGGPSIPVPPAPTYQTGTVNASVSYSIMTGILGHDAGNPIRGVWQDWGGSYFGPVFSRGFDEPWAWHSLDPLEALEGREFVKQINKDLGLNIRVTPEPVRHSWDRPPPVILMGTVVPLGAGGAALLTEAGAQEIGMLQSAARGSGNFGIGAADTATAVRLGEAWVGDGATVASDGETLISSDGLRQFRPPSFKPFRGTFQANFEQRFSPKGPWNSNGHLDILYGPEEAP